MHALVVGGTGMLKSVVLDLLQKGYVVTVIARHQVSLETLINEVGAYADHIHPVALDYANHNQLALALDAAMAEFGPIVLTVAWIYSSALQSLQIVAQYTHGDLFHIRSAAASQPGFQDPFDIPSLQAWSHIYYHQVILGFILEGNRSRWLNNAEIAKGIISALEYKIGTYVVGVVEPWARRPA